MAEIETLTFLDPSGKLLREVPYPIDAALLVKGYENMMVTRLFDERMITIQRQGLITFALSSLGEEACAVASAAALESGDWMYPQYREAGIMFWRGFSIQDFVHHMFGNSLDLILGRQMPNHYGSRALNIVSVSSPIGTKIPHAAGCAYAMKIQGEASVAICYFGEGATSEGDFHAGLNFAAVRKAPAIFFCRNNGYAISTPAKSQFASDGVAPKGIGYGMKTYRVDGNDFLAVYYVVKAARDYCIAGNGPVLIEAMTYRRGAHSTADDPTLYRLDDEVKLWEEKCPILRLKRFLVHKRLWDEEREQQLIQKVDAAITAAIEISKGTCRPELRSLVENVYFDVPQALQEQYAEIQTLFHEEGKNPL